MEAGECLATSLGCSFYADEAIPDTSFYNVAVSVTDDATGKCVGGENFIVRSLPRKAIKVTPERYISNGKRLPKGQCAYMVNYVSAGGFNSMVVVTFVVNLYRQQSDIPFIRFGEMSAGMPHGIQPY